MNPRAWIDGRGRLWWLELGLLWTFSRVRWAWWPIAKQVNPEEVVTSRTGRELTREELLSLVAEKGSPARPRVDAGGHCIMCGREAGEGRVYFGTRGPFDNPRCRWEWMERQPTVDRRSASAKR